SRPGGRGRCRSERAGEPVEESPDSEGQDAGQHPGGATRGQCHRNRPPTASDPGVLAGRREGEAEAGGRVKRGGKSSPAGGGPAGGATPVRSKAKQGAGGPPEAPGSAAAGASAPPAIRLTASRREGWPPPSTRGGDRIRLTGRLLPPSNRGRHDD